MKPAVPPALRGRKDRAT